MYSIFFLFICAFVIISKITQGLKEINEEGMLLSILYFIFLLPIPILFLLEKIEKVNFFKLLKNKIDILISSNRVLEVFCVVVFSCLFLFSGLLYIPILFYLFLMAMGIFLVIFAAILELIFITLVFTPYLVYNNPEYLLILITVLFVNFKIPKELYFPFFSFADVLNFKIPKELYFPFFSFSLLMEVCYIIMFEFFNINNHYLWIPKLFKA